MFNLFGNLIQFLSRRLLSIIRRQLEPESIAFVAGNYMEMNVKNFLHGCFAIRKKEIDSFDLYATLTQRCSKSLSDTKNLCAFLFL